MIDCHAHILPCFDDGAKDVETSLKMLSESRTQGVDKVISTSHCYPKSADSILHFVSRRENSFRQLMSETEKDKEKYPQIYLGCELNMLTDVSEYRETRLCCINKTDYILIEMPSAAWKEWMIEAVYKLTVRGYKPIMAHIDRYMNQQREMLEALYELDVLYQLNTEAFLSPAVSKQVRKLLENGRAHVLGSDMHNMESRAPNMKAAVKEIIRNYGSECAGYFEQNAMKIINGEEISDSEQRTFQRKGILEKLFKTK